MIRLHYSGINYKMSPQSSEKQVTGMYKQDHFTLNLTEPILLSLIHFWIMGFGVLGDLTLPRLA